jgi:hypothetical protein
MQLSKQLTKLSLMVSLLSLASCGSFQIADIGPMVTLPASQDCYRVTVLTQVKTRIPKPQCEEIKKRAIFLTSEDWKKQKISIQKNCQVAQCKQLVGAFDDLFLTLDDALKKVPVP